MIRSNLVVLALVGGLVSVLSTGCIKDEPAKDPTSAPGSPEVSSKPEGAPDAVNSNVGSSNTGNGSPGPEGGPGSLGAGIGSGSGTGTGAGPGQGSSSGSGTLGK